MTRAVRTCLVSACLFGAPLVGMVQAQAAVRGVVRDAATRRPLIGALVTLDVGEFARPTRTDETGAFVFGDVRPGEHLLAVRWLGYEEQRTSIDVRVDAPALDIALTRVQSLDTVRVRAARQAIYGVVGEGGRLSPIAGAAVQVIGMTKKAITDSSGRFFVEIKAPGPYVVRATAAHHAPQTLSVTVVPNAGVEVALLLDSASGNTRALDAAFADFTERLMTRRNGSALVTRAELLREGAAPSVFEATQSAPSFVKQAITWGDTVCVYVDGRPRPGMSVQLFDAQDVEAVEVYTKGSDWSGTLGLRWPRNAPCTDTGRRFASAKPIAIMPGRSVSSRLTRDKVYWLVVWLKH